MDVQDTNDHNALALEVVQTLAPQITALVTAALEKQNTKLGLESNASKDKEITSLKTKVADLTAQLAGARHENEVLRKNLIALIQSHTVQAYSLTDGTSSDNQTVPYATYGKLLQKVETLEKELLDSVDHRKIEASARSFLMNKLKTAKATARQWMDYHERWVAKHSDCRHAKSSKLAVTPSLEAESNRHVSVDRPAPLSPGIEAFESLFEHNGLLQDSGPQDKILAGVHQSIHNEGVDEHLQPPLLDISATDAELPSAAPSLTVPLGSAIAQVQPSLHHPAGAASVAQDNLPQPGNTGLVLHNVEDNGQTTSRLVPSTEPREQISKPTAQVPSTDILNAQTLFKPAFSLTDLVPPVIQHIKDEDDDLIIIGERTLKRRRKGSRASDSTVRVKAEKSSPENYRNRELILFRKETLDLDEITGTVPTPRKRKAKQNFMEQPRRARRLRHTSEPLESQKSSIELSPTLRPSVLPPATAPATRKQNTKVLAPVDPNTCLLPKAPDQKAKRTRIESRQQKWNDRVLFLGEDGTDIPENSGVLRSAVSEKKLARSNAHLSSLLDSANSKSSRAERFQFRVPAKPRDPRLRHKPLSSLQLEDFRLNPRIDHSRMPEHSRVARRCLPGCTDPRCCGDAMRALAESLKPKLPRPAFPESQEDAHLSDDEYLLKWYMGSTWDRETVTLMEPEEFSKLLLEARTRLLAERHGKHRADARRMTPPGFWDMPFPSTQELEKQRKEAEEINRALVRQRYEEAQRNGRWVFRDELNANE